MIKVTHYLAIAILGFLVTAAVQAAVRPSALFTDNAVLQAEAEVPIWGKANPGEKITVSFLDQKKVAVANQEGRWMVTLAPLKAGLTGDLIVVGENTSVARNVITGEVWLCCGQSNMTLNLERATGGAEEVAKADDHQLRFFKVPINSQVKPVDDISGEWMVCSPESAARFSAVSFFFGGEIRRSLDKPVGLIQSAAGGTPIQTWISEQPLKAMPIYQTLLDDWIALQGKIRKTEDEPDSNDNKSKISPKSMPFSSLFNGMIAPLVPYAIRGVIWYQGEANSHLRQDSYGSLLKTLIEDWRSRWKQDFWFAWVQLPNFRKLQAAPVEETDGWPIIREQMLKTLSVPRTGMVVTLGLGEAGDIHPKGKSEVGRRLATWALGTVYTHPNVETSGPVFLKQEIRGREIVLSFSHHDGLTTKDSKAELQGFAIAGEDRVWHWAKGRIEGETVVISSEQVEKPVFVRYAWADNPLFNLYNGSGLPAGPFRTDTFPFPDEATQNSESQK